MDALAVSAESLLSGLACRYRYGRRRFESQDSGQITGEYSNTRIVEIDAGIEMTIARCKLLVVVLPTLLFPKYASRPLPPNARERHVH